MHVHIFLMHCGTKDHTYKECPVSFKHELLVEMTTLA